MKMKRKTYERIKILIALVASFGFVVVCTCLLTYNNYMQLKHKQELSNWTRVPYQEYDDIKYGLVDNINWEDIGESLKDALSDPDGYIKENLLR